MLSPSVEQKFDVHYIDVLPVELWLNIFEWALESSLEPKQLPNSTTFPVIIHHLRHPWKYGPASDLPIRNLRLHSTHS